MEIGIAILLFVCMTALLYVLLSLKITRQVDLQIKEFYKTRIHADMQEFYREMEGYAALFENRIQRFRVLVDRNEAILREAEAPPQTTAPQSFEVAAEPEPALRRRRDKKNKNKAPQKAKNAARAKTVQAKTVPAKKTVDIPRISPVPRPQPAAVRFDTKQATEPAAPPRDIYDDNEDSTIAEELMKDLFLKDELEVAPKKIAASVKAAVEPEPRAESPGMANFFSRLGKAMEPVIFGEKKPVPQTAVVAPEPPAQAAPPLRKSASPSPVSDFGEVLRRAEQIKAEKKAEREKAEVEARAEFYAGGDSLEISRIQQPQLVRRVIAQTSELVQPHALPETETARELPRRNTLAVKELDRHTVNFLIDSLVKDNGYRRQALRALTENNIPLDEIARLSKIDIGELELMRQLGRF